MNLNLAAPGPWVDAIYYHPMSGECHYQMGSCRRRSKVHGRLPVLPGPSRVVLKVDFPPLSTRVERQSAATVGRDGAVHALGHFKPRFGIHRPMDNRQSFAKAGRSDAKHFPSISEIVRCTAASPARGCSVRSERR
jgi:hypothetical protein